MSPQPKSVSSPYDDFTGSPCQPIAIAGLSLAYHQSTQQPHYHARHQHQPLHNQASPLPTILPSRDYSQAEPHRSPSLQISIPTTIHSASSKLANIGHARGSDMAASPVTNVTSSTLGSPGVGSVTSELFGDAPAAYNTQIASVQPPTLPPWPQQGASVTPSGASPAPRESAAAEGIVDVTLSDGQSRRIGKVSTYKAERKQNSACDICRQRKVKCVRRPGEDKCANCLDKRYPCTDEMTRRYHSHQAANKKTPKRPRGAVDTSCLDSVSDTHKLPHSASSPSGEVFLSTRFVPGAKVDVRKDAMSAWEPTPKTIVKLVYQVVAVTLKEDEVGWRQWPINCVRLRDDVVASPHGHEGESGPTHPFPLAYGSGYQMWDQVNLCRETSQFVENSTMGMRPDQLNPLQQQPQQTNYGSVGVSSPEWMHGNGLRSPHGPESIPSDYLQSPTVESSQAHLATTLSRVVQVVVEGYKRLSSMA